jgi:hypothetical protein
MTLHLLHAVLALAGCLPRSAPARCTCIPTPRLTTPADAATLLADNGGSVFEGRILSTLIRWDSTLVDSASRRHLRYGVLVATVHVTQRWSGEVADTAQVETMQQTTMCGMHLVAGRRYLFVADRGAPAASNGKPPDDQQAVTWEVSKCGYSRPWDGEARRLARLFRAARARGT